MKTVIIIGAGPAGLTAGYELLKQSMNERNTFIRAYKEGLSDVGALICTYL